MAIGQRANGQLLDNGWRQAYAWIVQEAIKLNGLIGYVDGQRH